MGKKSPHQFLIFHHVIESGVSYKVGTEVTLGSTVASTFWGEQPAIETTTSVDILALNYVVYT